MILGVDPGLAHCGWALVTGGDVTECGCIVTEKGEATGDAQRRLEEIGRGLHRLITMATVVVVEWPGFGGARRPGAMNAMAASQTAAAAAMVVGLAWGRGRKTLQPAPVTWRAKLGHKRGKDEALHAELALRFSTAQLAAIRKGDLPHILDAIGLALYAEAITNPRPSAQLALA